MELEVLNQGIGKTLKNKNMLIFAAVGAGLGGIVLLMGRGKTAAEDHSAASLYPPEKDDTAAVVNQALEQSASAQMEMFQSLIDSQASANYAIVQSFEDISLGLSEQIAATQTSMQQQINSIVSQVQQVQQVQPIQQPVANPYTFSPNPDWTSQPDRPFSDFTVNDFSFRVNNDKWSSATDLDTAIKSGQASGVFSIVEHGGKLYNVDEGTGQVYKTW